MKSSENWLAHDHAEHEQLLVRCQDAVAMEDWKQANTTYRELRAALEWHITQEEEVVYPAFEATVQAPGEPTAALRSEHRKIMDAIKDTQRAFVSQNSEHVLDCLQHLEQLLIKHHEKEEDIFLPMASLILEPQKDVIMDKLKTLVNSKQERK